jgi:hypothetical protein
MSNSIQTHSPSKGPDRLPDFNGKISTKKGPNEPESMEDCFKEITENKAPLRYLEKSGVIGTLEEQLGEMIGVSKFKINMTSNRSTVCGEAFVNEQEIQIL